MPKFRRKPVEIEAVKVLDLLRHDAGTGVQQSPDWVEEARKDGVLEVYGIDAEIITHGDTMRVDLNDWIIRGVDGELYPIKDDIFRETYEAVTDR